MPFVPALGQTDFRALRADGAGYVDKTASIAQFLAAPTQVIQFTRPRRFGKTLFLSTLACFLEQRTEDLSHLFHDLAVWHDASARAHFQQHPVLFLSFKDVKARSHAATLQGIALVIQKLYRRTATCSTAAHCIPTKRAPSSAS
ncbi:AAA family ATPase [Chondromyces crocatus]|uniref:AAA-ATPase-like domain-containing protein n=1 Tax=Chondromyces crocatus TaxID=52 RepID=A0A0K1EMR1_CHOCO|nr:AAA family ATPase [Chondromyces crocatus]AKT42106.1 uncharacterized protein CMC5_063300 [Chondromyces crocatus]